MNGGREVAWILVAVKVGLVQKETKGETMFWQRGTSRNYPEGGGGGGQSSGGDKPPGDWKFHEVKGPTEAKHWLEEVLADGYNASISAYKEKE